ncbi:hypothetical protein RRG53_02450 [Mycoplasmopsis cynos]|uniref:Uncharacterized protein n=2 Tax=Mycoplasmopsis cynos TaxID=171284 RepID=A0A449AI61_9BACT|nr:hypothetical protein [Mycoplasmopsis cynos]UWV92036.1 hypothetical protein NWE57_03760 [Mycoplasmopsis cynos]WQQ13476.1 hypothetical protein RRG58_01875 [Mycoplasmopsis cynos]WQQ13751.1 hypothetical protein RRG52_03285 [Mycoplasmopsis cynos]WQQ15467.1 hypothetical protein RRG43_03945 [Mycoplasmopsis cynos]WQQ16527.1 hypothetical protein RRG51_02075 [Mycoplasmopsis cynos]
MKFLKCFLSKTSSDNLNDEVFFIIDDRIVETYDDKLFTEYLKNLLEYCALLNQRNIKFNILLPNTFSFSINETDEFFNNIEKRRKGLKKFAKSIVDFKYGEILQIIDFKNISSISFDINKKINKNKENSEENLSETFNLEFSNLMYTKNIIIDENENEKDSMLYKDLMNLYWFFSTKYFVSGFVFNNIENHIKTIPIKEQPSKLTVIDNIISLFKKETKSSIYSYNTDKELSIFKLLNLITSIDKKIIKKKPSTTLIQNILGTHLQGDNVFYYDLFDYLVFENGEYIFKIEQIKTLLNHIILNNHKLAFNFVFNNALKTNEILYNFDYIKFINNQILTILNQKRNKWKFPFARRVYIRYSFIKILKGFLIRIIKLDGYEYVEYINITNKVRYLGAKMFLPYQTSNLQENK